MRGHNVNIYFSEKIYNRIKDLIAQRKVSEFVNQAVEKELQKEEKQKKEQLRKKLILAHQRISQNQKKELALWNETADDYINKNNG